MMRTEERIAAFSTLGILLKEVGEKRKSGSELSERYYDRFGEVIHTSFLYNGWFTEENVRYALASLGAALQESKMEKWLSAYPELDKKKGEALNVGVIMAGNIPVVGFHDFVCVLMSGNKFLGKLSSDDKFLLPFIAEILSHIEPRFASFIGFIETKLDKIDAIIATGSDNSARYFEHYFSKYPHIIRKNRNSIAVLDGKETHADLEKLGDDIFRYFGLGCRNVSKLFVPEGYDFGKFFEAMFSKKDVLINNKYGNNYEYNRTIYLMGKIPLLDNNFMLLREEISMHSPVAVVFYEFYKEENLLARLRMDAPSIQCIVSNNKTLPHVLSFGETQQPSLGDYADRVDTMKFLIGLG